jgi:hypothetical protein
MERESPQTLKITVVDKRKEIEAQKQRTKDIEAKKSKEQGEKIFKDAILDNNIEKISIYEFEKIKSNGFSVKMPDMRKLLPEDHFINIYTKWISGITDGYYEYSVITAFWLLSALSKNAIILKLKIGTIRPNLWIFILGKSTTSRKTTIIKKARYIYEQITDRKSSNEEFSIEGYLKLLEVDPNHDFVRDEAGGLLAKYNKKYNEGIFDMECAIYDCQNVCKILAQETVTVENPCTTELYGTTVGSFFRNAKVETITSGWGYRYLYACPDYVKPRKDIGLETEEDQKAFESVIERAKHIFSRFDNSDQVNFSIDTDALEIYNEKIAELEINLDQVGNDMLSSAIGRYQMYALKLAMLIEIGNPEMSFTITKKSMEIALKLIAEYFLPTFQSLSESLEEDSKYNQVERVISTLRKLGNTATRSKLLKYSKLKARDFAEVLATLEMSQTISRKQIVEDHTEVIMLENENINFSKVIQK